MTALVADAWVAITEQADPKPSLPVPMLGRRLDDLAYGAGLWWGALRAINRRVTRQAPCRPHLTGRIAHAATCRHCECRQLASDSMLLPHLP